MFTSRTELYKILSLRDKYSTENVQNDDEKPEAPLREWAVRAKTSEYHVRALNYRSSYLTSLRELFSDVLAPEQMQEEVEDISVNALRHAAYGFESAYEKSLLDNAIDRSKSSNKPFVQARKIRLIRECIWERSMETNDTTTFQEWYDRWGFGATRGFIRNTIRHPNLRLGIKSLIAVRLRFFPSISKTWIEATFNGKEPAPDRKNVCPLCFENIDQDWDWAHLMMDCRELSICEHRIKYLQRSIELIHQELSITGTVDIPVESNGLRSFQGISGAVIAVYLVGGTFESYYGCSHTIGFGLLITCLLV